MGTKADRPEPDPRLLEGIQVFNDARHWHAHEAWEPLWLELSGSDKTFVQGLIVSAALLVHYGRGNPAGVLKHWVKVGQRLPRHGPTHWGIDVAGLLVQLERFVEAAGRDPPDMGLDVARVQIRLAR